MKKSLAVKMFVTLLISFLCVITITISFLFMYFQFFYEGDKISRVIDAMNNFSYQYLKADWSEPQLYQNIANFSNENGMEFNVYDYSLIMDYDQSIDYEDASMEMIEGLNNSSDSYYYITTINQDSYFDFILTTMEYNSLKSVNSFNNTDGIDVVGYIDSYNFLITESINGIPIESGNQYIQDHNMTEFQSFEGNVVIMSAQEIFNIDANALINGYMVVEGEGLDASDEKLMEDSLIVGEGQSTEFIGPEVILDSFVLEDYDFETGEVDGVSYTITHIPYTDYNQVSFSKFVDYEGSNVEFYGFLSMQPVGEIIKMITSLIPYFLLGAFLLALFIAYFYSRTVAKPIVDITKVADRMASMDLNVVSNINREDELGNLSVSLNTLAGNLRDSMDELVMKNKQLAFDMEQKVRQEEIRKAFVANASHELKTPLGVIKSYTEAINDGIKVEKKDYYMSVIMEEISHMDKLIQEMLILSKYDGGAQVYKKEIIDLDYILDSVKESLIKTAEKKHMDIKIKHPLGDAMGDQDKIHQVVMNLMSNAIKYGNEHSEIRIEVIEKNNHREVYFYNECDQIPEEDLEKLWDRFYKVDKSHNKYIEGNGLGLSIVKSILEGHEAKYGVYNTMKGVCFYFSLDKSVDIL